MDYKQAINSVIERVIAGEEVRVRQSYKEDVMAALEYQYPDDTFTTKPYADDQYVLVKKEIRDEQ